MKKKNGQAAPSWVTLASSTVPTSVQMSTNLFSNVGYYNFTFSGAGKLPNLAQTPVSFGNNYVW